MENLAELEAFKNAAIELEHVRVQLGNNPEIRQFFKLQKLRKKHTSQALRSIIRAIKSLTEQCKQITRLSILQKIIELEREFFDIQELLSIDGMTIDQSVLMEAVDVFGKTDAVIQRIFTLSKSKRAKELRERLPRIQKISADLFKDIQVLAKDGNTGLSHRKVIQVLTPVLIRKK